MGNLTKSEIDEFNIVRELALQELAGYKGKRVSTYAKKSVNPNISSKEDKKFVEHGDTKYKLRANTEMYRKPDLTKERVNNIIDHTDRIRKYDPATLEEIKSLKDALNGLKSLLSTAHVANKQIASKYGKKHLTTQEAINAHGVLGIFKRSLFQAGSDNAFESAIGIVDRAINRVEKTTFKPT